MAKLLIDGYNKECTIGPAHGLPAVRIVFRPALAEEVALYQRKPAIDAKDDIKIKAKFLQDHLTAWDVEDAKGDKAEITEDNIRKIPIAYITRMIDEVAQVGQGSEDAKN